MTQRLFLAAVIGLAFALPAMAAQAPAAKRTIVNTVDIPSAPPQELHQGFAEIPVGGESGAHIHPGIEAGVVMSGVVEMTLAGGQPRRLTAGDTFLIPRGVAHNTRNIGDAPAKVSSNWIVDKGAPFATPKALDAK